MFILSSSGAFVFFHTCGELSTSLAHVSIGTVRAWDATPRPQDIEAQGFLLFDGVYCHRLSHLALQDGISQTYKDSLSDRVF